MRSQIDRALEGGSAETLVSALVGAAAADIEYAAHRLGDGGESPQKSRKLATSFAAKPVPESRLLACHLLHGEYASSPDRSLESLVRLVDDDEPSVRDTASTVAGRLLREDFDGMLGALLEWRTSSSPSVRRAVAVAAGRAAQPHRPEWAEPLLKLIEPLLKDRDRLTRRALGPSALGGSLLDCYPRIAFEYLTQWSTSNDSQVLWNVAMAFSTPAAATMVKKAIIILRKLSLDERRFVWRAVASALWKLGRKAPEIVRPELARWIEDERRVDVAREALKHL